MIATSLLVAVVALAAIVAIMLVAVLRSVNINVHVYVDDGEWDDGDGGDELDRAIEQRDPPRSDEEARFN